MVRSSSAPKREEVPMKFTTFHVPPVINTKNVSSSYLRSESQSIWARNAAANAQRKRTAEEAFTGKEKAVPGDAAPGSKTLVIHPGSRWLKIGMATDVFPASVPFVIARKRRVGAAPEPTFFNGVIPPASERNATEESPESAEEDPFVERTAGIRSSLLARMKFYKLEVLPKGSSEAARINANFKPSTIADHNDPYRVEWLGSAGNPIGDEEVFIGEKALLFGDAAACGFTVKWPIRGNSLNTRDYDSVQEIISDIETIWSRALLQELKIPRSRYKASERIASNYFDRFYVRELVNVLLVQMGFSQLCIQQESLCAAFGAGLSTACVVDIGAVKTSIACVDEGQVVPDTRITLDMGGDDITEYLYYLLKGINWPYRDFQLNRMHDWNLMTRLKKMTCSLAETDVALNLYDFDVRRPGHITERYTMQVYDEPVVAAMCIFEPRIIDFDAKRSRQRLLWTRENVEDVPDFSSDILTQAMLISTQHLLPQQPPVQTFPSKQQVPQLDGAHDADGDTEMDVGPQPDVPAEGGWGKGGGTMAKSGLFRSSTEKPQDEKQPTPVPDETPVAPRSEDVSRSASVAASGQHELATSAQPESPTEVEIVPAPETSKKKSKARQAPVPPPAPAIDVRWEASKLPLDVAIFNSARAAGGVDRIKKFLQVVVIVGGTSMIPGMVHALESRLQAIAFPLVPGMEKVQVVPSPKDIDPRVLSWKGGAVLAKLEALNEVWITPSDWDMLGMRALRERTLFM